MDPALNRGDAGRMLFARLCNDLHAFEGNFKVTPEDVGNNLKSQNTTRLPLSSHNHSRSQQPSVRTADDQLTCSSTM